MCAVVSMMVRLGRLWRWPMAKSLGSCAGVTLTAPVPNSGLAQSSATMGISRPVSGSAQRLADEGGVALVGGIDGDGDVAEHGLGPRGGDDDASPMPSASG